MTAGGILACVTPDPAHAPATATPPADRPVVATDLEGTCTTGETWRGLGRYLSSHGRSGAHRLFLVPRLAALPLVRLGLIEKQAFKNRWVVDLARLLAGVNELGLASIAGWILEEELWPRRRREIIAELAAAARAGARLVLASGTYQPVLDAFARRLAVEIGSVDIVALGTPFEMRDGRATGRLAAPVGTGPRKAERVAALAAGAPVVAAYGDSAADRALLELAREPVAVAPDRELAEIALARGWRIIGPPGAPR